MSKDVLLEIGAEEIPARFMPGILAQLADLARRKLSAAHLAYQSVKTYGTPRRMALIISELAERQDDLSLENKGPSLQVAFDADGRPTKAAQGFARGQKVAVDELVVKDGYVYAMVNKIGLPAADLLPEIMQDIINSLNFPKNMRWAGLEVKFVRPIRWLVALYGAAVIDFTVATVRTGRVSRGHRFLGAESITLADAADYVAALAENSVMVDQDARRAVIREQIEKLAAEHGGQAEITEELLEEVVYLVEYPTALCGGFEDKYLKLPAEAVITPMREHQRYFPVKNAAGKLLPLFITVRNGGGAHIDTVRRGNERVLRARLADAQFFYEEDCKVKLVERLEKLKTVVFQDGLGTIYDKCLRLGSLARYLLTALEMTEVEPAIVERSALLSKADLVSGMVCEFTELQGIMGREYAMIDGEDERVAEAIYEHYLPRFAGDALPATTVGRIVSIADKLDNIVATFSRGLIPTGSQDPYALRRQALGIVNIAIEAGYRLSLAELVGAEMRLLAIDDAAACDKMQRDVSDFFKLRLKNILTGEGIRYDVIDAVLENGCDDIYEAHRKAKAVAAALDEPVVMEAVQAFVRVGNLAKKAQSRHIDEKLFSLPEEQALYDACNEAADNVRRAMKGLDFSAAISALCALTAPVNEFFDKVMVMDKDEAVKNNRLALLRGIIDVTAQIADFSKIV